MRTIDKNTFGSSPAAETLVKMIMANEPTSKNVLSKVSRVLERYSKIIILVNNTDFTLGNYVLEKALKDELKIVDDWEEKEIKTYTKNLLTAKFRAYKNKKKNDNSTSSSN